MKKLLFIIFVLGISQGIFAQDGLKRANLYFERTFYSDAIPLYEQLLERHKSPELIKNLADCYYSTFDMEAAARWYTYLASNYGSRMDESYYFKLNQSLKAIGDYDRANQVLLDFYAQHYGADKVDQLKTEITYLENVRAIGERFTISNLDIKEASGLYQVNDVKIVLDQCKSTTCSSLSRTTLRCLTTVERM